MHSMLLQEQFPDLVGRIAQLRRDIHAHPELAFAETRTAALVADYLTGLGLEVHTGIANTGVVAVLRAGNGQRCVGLRADMDGLPLEERNHFPHRSRLPGQMHACGHDGHTAMLLGAADVLSKTRQFDGTVVFIFQPAEEHDGGGQRMVEEGLFQRFPMDMVFGLHNWPGLPEGSMAVHQGPVMAGADRFAITISGRGGHAAMPQQAVDVVLAGSALVQALQSLVSRNTDPLESAVLSVTRFEAGHADNVLPEKAKLGGTVRTFRPDLQAAMETGMRRICTGIEATYGVGIDLDYERGYPPTINADEASFLCREVARQVAAGGEVFTNIKPSMGAEDFSYLAQEVPACYVWLGNGLGEGGGMLHSPHYDFNDRILATGIRYWVRLAERALSGEG